MSDFEKELRKILPIVPLGIKIDNELAIEINTAYDRVLQLVNANDAQKPKAGLTVAELIQELQKLPPSLNVMLAFEGSIRAEAEIAKCAMYHDDGKCERVAVITYKEEWESREDWS